MSSFGHLSEIVPHQLFAGVLARAVWSESITYAYVELEPDAFVPEHGHVNEQVGVLLTGSLQFRIGDEERELGPGATWSIPAHVPHEVKTGPEGATLIEVFSPVRADWGQLERGEAAAPGWLA